MVAKVRMRIDLCVGRLTMAPGSMLEVWQLEEGDSDESWRRDKE